MLSLVTLGSSGSFPQAQPSVTAGWEAARREVMRYIQFCLQIAFSPVERGTSKCAVLLPHKEDV